jgi:aminoglycoside/choline kinase family phosphotransferase
MQLAKEKLLQAFRDQFGSSISELQLKRMVGDASTREYFRVFLPGNHPSTAILMVLPEPISKEPEGFPFLNIRSFLEKIGIPVPGNYFTIFEDGIVALEDCGIKTLEETLKESPPKKWGPWYREALDLLIRMQTSQGHCHAFSYSFTPITFEKELLFFLEHAVKGLWERDIDSGHMKSLRTEIRQLSKSLVSNRQVFTHRDYHSRNLMPLGDFPRLSILDFQDARLGPPVYDVASLLYDSYVLIPEEMRGNLIQYYRKRWLEITGEHLCKEEFENTLKLAAIQRNLKAIGTFAYQGCVLGRKHYLESIPLTLSYLWKHAQVSPNLKDFWASLLPLIPKAETIQTAPNKN